jgi:hypothetical protein
MLVYVVYIAMQVKKYFGLFVILQKKIHEMRFLCLNPCSQVYYKFEFLHCVNRKYDFFHLEATIFMYISLEVYDIEIDKFINVFSCMFVYVDVFVQQEFHFEEDIDMLLNIYSQNFQCLHLEKYQIWTHNNPWS